MIPDEISALPIKPGDIIAFSGTDLPSDVVKIATHSHYVHVALVFAVTPSKQRDRTILIAESHIDTSLPSLGTGKRIIGVQLHWLSQRLALPGPIWWAALQQPLPPENLLNMQTWLSTLEQNRAPYDFVDAIKVGVEALFAKELDAPKPLQHLPPEHAFFCSELVTRALQIAAVLPPTLDPADQTPAAVMQFPCFQPPVLLKPAD